MGDNIHRVTAIVTVSATGEKGGLHIVVPEGAADHEPPLGTTLHESQFGCVNSKVLHVTRPLILLICFDIHLSS